MNSLYVAEMNVKRLEMEKGTLETDNIRLNQELSDIRERLNRLSSDVLPRLTRIEETHSTILDELKNIRQDAELLPGMFRKEAIMKNTIREESIKAIEEKRKAKQELKI
mmetsp:Transcript_12873/g.1957  ORF Transcript_12873/g.1957 Transcript_12873/m.1957 type:complete len:109 (-) Transcript_12873:352-678(-)